MGKKKSVVLTTLITIVIVVLTAVALFPSFHLSFFKEDSVKTWNPVTSLYDLDEELSGGYVARYYPDGVISGTEYQSNYVSIEKQETAEKLEEYVASYEKHGDVYLSTDADDGVLKRGSDGKYTVDPAFDEWFTQTARLVADRFASMQYSSINVSVADDYVLEVSVPSSGASSSALSAFAYTGSLTVSDGTNEYPGKLEKSTDYFTSFKLKTSGSSAYIQIKTTNLGSEKLSAFNEASTTTVSFNIGGQTLISPQGSYIENISGNTWAIGVQDEVAGEILAIALDSALHYGMGDSGFAFAQDKTEIASYDAIYGENGKIMLYVAALIALAVAIVLPIILYKGYGVAIAFGELTYALIVAYLYAYVTNAIFEVSAASAFLFVSGLVLVFIAGSCVYKKIKEEVSSGKTVVSAVKNAHKKALLPTLDVCVVCVLASVALLICASLAHTVAIQAIICCAAASFACLLWVRVINHLLLSAAKDKYAFYRLKREDDDDE